LALIEIIEKKEIQKIILNSEFSNHSSNHQNIGENTVGLRNTLYTYIESSFPSITRNLGLFCKRSFGINLANPCSNKATSPQEPGVEMIIIHEEMGPLH